MACQIWIEPPRRLRLGTRAFPRLAVQATHCSRGVLVSTLHGPLHAVVFVHSEISLVMSKHGVE